MRAMVLRGKQLTVEDVDRPQPGPGQVLARVRACGICGSDLHFARYADQMLMAAGERDPIISRSADLQRGIVMGHEFMAEVVESGPGAEGWTPGTRVTSVPVLVGEGLPGGRQSIGYSPTHPGAYGEYVLMSASLLLRVPDGVPDKVAATTEPCAVGLHAVRMAQLQGGERVLVMGVGPIGMMTLLWLKREGAGQVVVSDFAAPRRELARRMGADVVLDPAGQKPAEWFAANGGPPQVIFECVGVEGTLQQAMELAPRRGRIVVVGVCMLEDRVRPYTGIAKELNLQFVLGYTPEEYREALEAIGSGAVDTAPLVTRTITLDELPAAFQSLSEPTDCKVVLVF